MIHSFHAVGHATILNVYYLLPTTPPHDVQSSANVCQKCTASAFTEIGGFWYLEWEEIGVAGLYIEEYTYPVVVVNL